MRSVSSERKTALLTQFARVGKAMASPTRLELLDLLAQAERSVEALAAAARMPVGNTSAQLRALHAAGMVTSRRVGARVFYRLASGEVAGLYRALCEVARTHLPDAEAARLAYLGSDEPAEPVSRPELLRRAAAGEVLVMDVRPAEEYAAGHIPGALSVPLGELPARLDALPEGLEIVAYCRGAYCVLAHGPTVPRSLRSRRLSGRRLREPQGGLVQAVMVSVWCPAVVDIVTSVPRLVCRT